MQEDLMFAHSTAILEFCGTNPKAGWNIQRCEKDHVSSVVVFLDEKEDKIEERLFLTTVGTMKKGFTSGIIYY